MVVGSIGILGMATADAQGRAEVAIIGCRNAAIKELRTARPGTANHRFASGPTVQQLSAKEMGVQGTGEYIDRNGTKWRRFDYDCIYRPSSAKTRVTVRFPSDSG
jgi:hypothetical protein